MPYVFLKSKDRGYWAYVANGSRVSQLKRIWKELEESRIEGTQVYAIKFFYSGLELSD